MLGLDALVRFAEVAEPREVGLEVEIEVTGGAVAVLGELQPHDALLTVLAVLLPQEHDEVGVGLERSRLAEVREHRLGPALLDLSGELRDRDDRYFELARDRFQGAADARDLEHPALLILSALDELQVVDDHEVEASLGLQAA